MRTSFTNLQSQETMSNDKAENKGAPACRPVGKSLEIVLAGILPLGVRGGSMKRWLAHLGISTLMALAFGLVAGYYVSIYYVGHFSVEVCL